MENDVDDDAECCTLPQSDLGETLGNNAVENREDNRKAEVDDEAHDWQAVAIEMNERVSEVLAESQLL